jgi:hypothetical protein
MGRISRTSSLESIRKAALPGFLFLALLYGIVPTEGGGANFAVFLRLGVAGALVLFVLVLFKPRLSKTTAYLVCAIFLFSLMAAFRSFSGGLFALWFAVVFAATLSAAAMQNILFRKSLSTAVLALIVCSVASLFLQIGIYLFSGVALDFHKMLYPFSDARIAESFGLVRFTGLYIEPGTYSNWLYLLLLIYLVLSSNKKPYVIYLVAGSMIATFSAWGAGVAILLVLVTTVRSLRQVVLLIIFVSVFLQLVPTGSLYGALDIFEHKTALDRVDAGAKIEAYEEFQRIVGDIAVIGNGFASKFCEDCFSPQDAGFAINLAVVMGATFCVGVFGYYFSRLFLARDFGLAALSLPLLFTKAFYWEFAVWLLFFLVVSRPKKSSAKFAAPPRTLEDPSNNWRYLNALGKNNCMSPRAGAQRQ